MSNMFCSCLRLQGQIKDAMGVSTYQFANLYSWYSWPNVVLPIVGGYLMDTVFGIRLGTIIFALFIIIGELAKVVKVRSVKLSIGYFLKNSWYPPKF